MTAQCEDVDFDLSIAEFRINGYAVLEDVFSVSTADRIRAAFLPMLEHIRKRETGIADREWGGLGNRLRPPNRMSTARRWRFRGCPRSPTPRFMKIPLFSSFSSAIGEKRSSTSNAFIQTTLTRGVSTSTGTETRRCPARFRMSVLIRVRYWASSFRSWILPRRIAALKCSLLLNTSLIPTCRACTTRC